MPTVRLRECDFEFDVAAPPAGAATATPLVWGHGLTSSRSGEDAFALLDFDAIAADRVVVRYDARGHGASGDLASPADGAWSELALDELALVDHLGLGSVVLGGASMGAATALHAALRARDRVAGLVLIIPPTAWDDRAAQVELYEVMAATVESEGPEPLVRAAAAMPPPDPLVGDARWVERRTTTLRTTPPHRLAAAFRGAGAADLPAPDALAGLTMPALVLAWSGDPGHPVSTAERLGELLPDASVHVAASAADLSSWTARCVAFLRATGA